MDPTFIAPLVLSVWKLIEPYAGKVGGKLLEKAGEALPDVVGKLWDTVKEKMEGKPETASLPADLAATPDDPAVQGAFQYQLKKLLENDEAFARQLQQLVEDAKKQGVSYSAKLKGDGAIAQGPGATAVGKGGVHIGGNASGSNLVTGNNNTINSQKKKKS